MKTQTKQQPEQFDGTTPIVVMDAGSPKKKSDLLRCAKHVGYAYVIHASQEVMAVPNLKWKENPDGGCSITMASAMRQMENTKPTITKIYRLSYCIAQKDLQKILSLIKELGCTAEVIEVQ